MQNCYLFCLCLSFRLKVKKRYLFWKRSQVFSAFEWMIFWRQYCPLFIYFSLYQTSLLLRRFVFRMVEASAKRLTGDEPQGTMGRVQTAGEARLARCLLPAFLCAHTFIKRETSGYEAVTKRRFKAQKRYLFVAFKRSHERGKKVPFFQLEAMFSKAPKWYLFALGSNVVKSAKKVPF